MRPIQLLRHVAVATSALLVATLSVACRGDDPLAPPGPASTPIAAAPVASAAADGRAFTAAPALLDALADAETRVAPALALDVRASVRAALADLRAALDAGHRGRSAEALGTARGMLTAVPRADAPTTDAPTTDAPDATDRAAIAMLLDAVAGATIDSSATASAATSQPNGPRSRTPVAAHRP